MASLSTGSNTSRTSSTEDVAPWRARCDMQGAVLYGPRDIRFEDRAEPAIVDPTDAIISLPGDAHLRFRPLALSRHLALSGRYAHGPRVLRLRRRGRPGADSVLECVGTQESMMQAIKSTRPGGSVGYVGVPHGVSLDGADLFFRHVRLLGGPAPVRRYLPQLIDLVFAGKINPGKVFDLVLPLDQVAEGYRAMDERRAIKALLRP